MSNSLATSPNPNYTAGTETVLDRVRASYLQEGAEERLTKADKQRRDELETAHSLLTQYHSLEQAAKIVGERYQFSRATAYRRCREAIELFGDVTRTFKEGIRHLLYEMSMRVFQLAAAAKDEFNRPAPDLKSMNTAIGRMAKLKGLDKVDSNLLTPDVLAHKTYVVNLTIQGSDGQARRVPLSGLDQLAATEPETYAQLLEAAEGTDLTPAQMRQLLGNNSPPTDPTPPADGADA